MTSTSNPASPVPSAYTRAKDVFDALELAMERGTESDVERAREEFATMMWNLKHPILEGLAVLVARG